MDPLSLLTFGMTSTEGAGGGSTAFRYYQTDIKVDLLKPAISVVREDSEVGITVDYLGAGSEVIVDLADRIAVLKDSSEVGLALTSEIDITTC